MVPLFRHSRLWIYFLSSCHPPSGQLRRADRGSNREVHGFDAGQALSIYLVVRARGGSCRCGIDFCGLSNNRVCSASASVAQLCPANGPTLWLLSHRFRWTDALRPPLQNRRLHLWRRALSDEPVFFRRLDEQQSKDMGATDFGDGDSRAHPHRSADGAANRSIQNE